MNRTVPVIFDWQNEYDLVCLLPQRVGKDYDYAGPATCFRITRALVILKHVAGPA